MWSATGVTSSIGSGAFIRVEDERPAKKLFSSFLNQRARPQVVGRSASAAQLMQAAGAYSLGLAEGVWHGGGEVFHS